MGGDGDGSGGDSGWAIAGPPAEPTAVPEVVRRIAGPHELVPVWRNQLGGLTFQVPAAGRFVKWAPPGRSATGLLDEVERLRWAKQWTPVPEVLDAGREPDGSAWLVSRALPGESAVSERWRTEPRTAVRAIGEGLRALHDTLPLAACPFSWSVSDRLGRARAAAEGGGLDPAGWHPSHRHLSVDDALAAVAALPAEEVVVCHGDACAPNTLVGDDGRWSGHVDLGRLGRGDRWADLAVATWSTEWNYGPGWEGELLDAYGIEPDPQRSHGYRLLWDLAD